MSKLQVYRGSDTNIIIIESILTIIALSAILRYKTHIHLAICIAISFLISVAIFRLFNTKIGFYIISIFFSLVWALVGLVIAYGLSKNDWTWAIVTGVFVFMGSLVFHGVAKRFVDNVEEY